MRLVFAGTPDPAVPSLRALLESEHDVVAVITRPDARKGRGRKLHRSPVGDLAADAGLPLLQPRSAKDPEFQAELASIEPDVCPVVAYGAILPPPALVIPKYGWVNLHFSLLPAWRGAAPVQHAIRHGDEITGASTFLIEEGMDTGPVFGVVTETVRSTDTSGNLLDRLAESGAGLLVKTMDAIESGEIRAVPQESDGISLAPKVTSEDARIDWNQPAVAIDRLVRSCTPAPGAWTEFRGMRVKVMPVEITAESDLGPGELSARGKSDWLVGTGSAAVRLGMVQPQGKRPMVAADWLRGIRGGAPIRFD